MIYVLKDHFSSENIALPQQTFEVEPGGTAGYKKICVDNRSKIM